MIIWCFLTLSLKTFPELGGVETALQGKVIQETETGYFVDFSGYATIQGYEGNFSRRFFKKDECVKE